MKTRNLRTWVFGVVCFSLVSLTMFADFGPSQVRLRTLHSVESDYNRSFSLSPGIAGTYRKCVCQPVSQSVVCTLCLGGELFSVN
jgi:hypothetical protein